MPSHWTYGDFKPEDDLLQGDIISRSDEFVEMLKSVFPYFCAERNTGFLVTTQSCDLVRRSKKKCKAKYITLAVIRELEPLLPELLEEVCGSGFPGIYKKESLPFAEQLLIKIINQNEQARGVFYLHQDADAGLATPNVALLRITFSLKQEHYELLTRSRCGRIQGEFANKLGWLAGNLYSRVATPDWEDLEKADDASRKQAKRLLEYVTEQNAQNWVSENWINEAKGKGINLEMLNPESAVSELEKHAPLEPIEIIIQRMQGIGRELLASNDIKFALGQSREFLLSFSERLLESTNQFEDRKELTQAASLLVENDDFCDAVCISVVSEAKKRLKINSEKPIEHLLTGLAEKKGTIGPVTNKLVAIIDSLNNESIKPVADANLFGESVLEHVEAVVRPILSEYSERQKEVAARIRKDAEVKTAIRRMRQHQVSFSE